MKSRVSRIVFWSFLALLAAASIAFSLGSGSIDIPPRGIADALISRVSGNAPAGRGELVVVELRLPRTVAALLVGGALAAAGVLFQGLFRNPLVEPYTLGVSGGAAIGISLGIVLGGPDVMALRPLLGFAGGVAAIAVVWKIAGKGEGTNRLLLVGVMVSFISSALIMSLLAVAGLDRFRPVLYWTMGSLAGTDPVLVAILGGLEAVCLVFALSRAWKLNALGAGEEIAAGLGVDLRRERLLVFAVGALLAGGAVAVAGVIGFVGLLVPHAVRHFTGLDHRRLLPAAFLAGGTFLVLCDTLARTLFADRGIQLPVGAVTGLSGGVIFLMILAGKNGRER
ncbi:MAG TPA: iron ABC transporter permease [bacterium]|nr:iron ABC transporter permease [bacterium]HPQ66217.1 iron ABC transporter permease [bacterium]